MFWRLGFISAWRNLERSVLALISMALAAGFMTNATSLSRGYAQMNRASYRSLIGGEISAYSLNISATAERTDAIWQYQELLDVGNTDLPQLMPELLANGYISSSPRDAFTEESIRTLAAQPTIKAVYPRYQLPALSSEHLGMRAAPLRGRDLDLDARQAQPLAQFISAGRWFHEEDQGQPVAVIMTRQYYSAGRQAPGVGALLQIVVPRISQRDGVVRYDYNDPLLLELRVIGVLTVPTREVSYLELSPPDPPLPGLVELRTQMMMQSDEIHIPLVTWQKIWREAGGQEYRPQQLGLMVDDLSYLEDIVVSLRQQFPEHSFYSVPQLIDRSERGLTLESPEKPAVNPLLIEALAPSEAQEQTVLALDLRLPMMVLIFVNAALIIASNLLIMVSERKVEIGILKAVGSTRSEVVQMVLSEALLISILGSLAGFVFFRLPAVFNQMTNGVTFSALSQAVFFDLGLVLGVACLTSLIFGMIPALTMANLSVREVLQSE